MHLKVKRLDKNAIIPERANPTDSGLDLFYCGNDLITLKPLERFLTPTGIAIELPPNTEAQIRPKSGLASKKGLTVLNTPGTIDNSFRGEIKVILINLSTEDILIAPNEKIAQLVVTPVLYPDVIEVESLSNSDRGENGFGSTGLLAKGFEDWKNDNVWNNILGDK